MSNTKLEQWTIENRKSQDYLLTAIESFLIDRKVQNLSKGTLYFYRAKMRLFIKFCEGQEIQNITQLDSTALRRYLLWLEETGHNPGGQHAAYRAVKAFLHWWEQDTDPESWIDPTKKVKSPRLVIEPLEPVTFENVQKLLSTCDGNLLGLRDKALILFLLDTGSRANEALSVTLEDVDISTGAVIIRQGKGRKSRMVFIGKKCRKAVRIYLNRRDDSNIFLWLSKENEPLTYWGLRMMIARRSQRVGIKPPEVHAFRRAFALSMLRSGVDIYSIQRLMGHADLQVLRRYLDQTTEDLRLTHIKASPADRL